MTIQEVHSWTPELNSDDIKNRVAEIGEWFSRDRFKEIIRLYSPHDVFLQQGTINNSYSLAREAAESFYHSLKQLFKEKKSATTFGPYSSTQAVMMKLMGIPFIYLGGWASSAKGSALEEPGADLANYALSRVPEEAEAIVKALIAADKNQTFLRSKMSKEDL